MRTQFFAIAVSLMLSASVAGQDCTFSFANDDSFDQAKEKFHDVMADLWHGPVQEGNIEPVREKIEELLSGRDELMNSALPEKYRNHCPEISAKAAAFSDSVEQLAKLVRDDAEPGDIVKAFSKMHDDYRSLAQSMLLPEDLLETFHDVLQPVWHEAYPNKDIEAIKKSLPSMKVRAKLIVQIAGKTNSEEFLEAAKALLDSVTTVGEAIDAGDNEAALKAVELLHDAYHTLTEVKID